MYSNYDSYTYQTSSLLDTINGLGKFINIISLIIGILSLIAMYKLYKKLGMPGWYALIPIYNIVKLFYIQKRYLMNKKRNIIID